MEQTQEQGNNTTRPAMKITVKTPSETIIENANSVTTVVAGGKVLGLKKPGVLSQYRLVEIVGPAAAKNEVYMGMVMPVLWATEIDGDPVLQIHTKVELEALIQRLGEEGISAIMEHLQKQGGTQEAGEAALKN